MVDVLGHLGMALIWLSPAWYFVDRRDTAAVFVAGSFPFGLLPDVDLYLSRLSGIHHHGVVHTVLAVTLMALVVGPLLGRVFTTVAAGTDWFSDRGARSAYEMGVIGVWVAGLAHLFADMLSAPDVSTPIEPFWPLFHGGLFSVDVLWYQSWWATWGLLVLGVAVNVAAWYWKGEDGRSADAAVASE